MCVQLGLKVTRLFLLQQADTSFLKKRINILGNTLTLDEMINISYLSVKFEISR